MSDSAVSIPNHLLSEWNSKNSFSPSEVKGKWKMIWWKCNDCDHEWRAYLENRIKGHGCRMCGYKSASKTKKTPKAGKSLAEMFSDITLEWDYEKNNPLKPSDVNVGTKKKVWWICNSCGNNWEASIEKRTRSGRGCPPCGTKRAAAKRMKPKEGKSLGDLHPEVAKQWHIEKNDPLTPFDVNPGSNKKAWWKCPLGEDHEWASVIANRTRREGDCPICSNKIVVKSNCLRTTKPNLVEEWDFARNSKLKTKNGSLITPDTINEGSQWKVSWICRKSDKHRWESTVYVRAILGQECPYCSKKSPSSTNNLAINHPELAAQWHGEKNGESSPTEFLSGSSKKVWWRCSAGPDHEWQASISSRARGAGCPCCTNLRVVKSNCLATTHPKVAEQWHHEKNEGLTYADGRPITPNTVAIGSNKKVWWKCPEEQDHEWPAVIHSRTGLGCPCCLNQRTVNSNCLATTHPKIAEQWHHEKNEGLTFADGRFLTPETVTIGSNKKVWWKCAEAPDHEWPAIIQTREQYTCPCCSNQRVVKSNCLATTHPDIAEQWHHEKNEGLTFADGRPIAPNTVAIGSNKKVWWKCHEAPDHEWPAMIYTREESGCACCAGKLAVESNCLETLYPEIAEQWHPTKNKELVFNDGRLLTPRTVIPGSHSKVWWKCPVDEDHEWMSTIRGRSIKGAGCLCCSGLKVVPSNCLEKTHPHIASQWDYERNSPVTPKDVTSSTYKHYYWKCDVEHNHRWRALITSRMRSGCPACAETGYNPSKPGQYYALRIKNKSGDTILYKGGISNKYKQRFKQHVSTFGNHPRSKNWELVIEEVHHFEDGADARDLESKLLRTEIRANNIVGLSNELFDYNPLEFAREKGWI
jgi:hypothetical protein